MELSCRFESFARLITLIMVETCVHIYVCDKKYVCVYEYEYVHIEPVQKD